MSLKQLFCEKNGKPSLKRIVGITLITNGLLGKNLLCIYAARHIVTALANFDNINSSCDGMILAGIALLFGTVIDKFVKHDNVS